MYHPRIFHFCNVKVVAPLKRLNSKALIYLFYLFVSWFHNRIGIVLQEERPIAFKICPIKGKYLHKAIYEKEMLTILHALKK